MTSPNLIGIYEGIAPPETDDASAPLFAVRPVPELKSYYVGKDSAGLACLLVATMRGTRGKPPPIRLESLDAQFELPCRIKSPDGQLRDGLFTVVRCRSQELETVHYFLSVCRIIILHIGDSPSRTKLAAAVRRIASIFQSIKKPPVRSLNGLFGELFLIFQSRSPSHALAAWRIDDSARFDFSLGDVRMEVKSCAGRVRIHRFSYDQCNPRPNTHAVVASMLVERIPGGISVGDLINRIEAQVSNSQEMVLKLHEIVASTLGDNLTASLHVTFDQRLVESSLLFFDLGEIPALRDPIPPRVSEVRFSVDLSGFTPLSTEMLNDRDPDFWYLTSGD